MKFWHWLLDIIFGWMKIPDSLPLSADALFVHTYSATKRLNKLTDMSQSAMITAITTVAIRSMVEYAIFSLAKYGEKKEKQLRSIALSRFNLRRTLVFFLRGAVDTYDEMLQLATILKNHEAKSLIMVADQYHMWRSLMIARRLFPSIKIYNVSSICQKYEAPCASDDDFSLKYIFQRISISSKLAHILWNLLFIMLTPYLLRRVKPLVE